MFEQYTEQLQREAIAAYPQEAVWLITPGECRRVKNIAAEPTQTFQVDKRTMGAAVGRGPLEVVPSRPDYPACPSAADMRGQAASGVPWGIVATDGERASEPTWFGDQVDRAPLVGRGFRHGVTDCYALIRDYYRLELGIDLIEFPRDWEWWLNGGDLYRDGIAPAGFRRIEQAEAMPGDMWIAQLRSPVPNHGGVLLEHGLALHHPSGRDPVDGTQLSRREPIGRWLPHITLWLRHESR